MRLRSNIQTTDHILLQARKTFPSRNLVRNEHSPITTTPISLMAHDAHHPNRESNEPQLPTYHHLVSFLRNSSVYGSLQLGKIGHSFILRSGWESNLFLSNNLLHVYSTCCSISQALHLFVGMPLKDVVSWNTMISGFVRSEMFADGFSFFREMLRAGYCPTQSSFASVLVASAEMCSSVHLFQVHGLCLKSGFSSDCCVGNALLKGLVEFGGLDELRKLSEEMIDFDEISLEILLKGYAKHGCLNSAFELLRSSSLVGVNLSPNALSCLISLCVSLHRLDCGIQIHGYVVKACLDMDVSVSNSLITLYSRSSRLDDAERLFDSYGSRDFITWSSLISGFAFNGEGDAGVGLVQRLFSDGLRMNESTFLSFLSCCATVTLLENAKIAHVLVLKFGKHVDQGIDNILLKMYCKCRRLGDATTIFEAMEVREITSFNLLMGLYRKVGWYEESIILFVRAQSEGLQADEEMLSGALCMCSKLYSFFLGLHIHGCIIRTGYENDFHLKNSLLEMYSQCGKFDGMEKFFCQIDRPDLFSWNTMLMGYTQCGLFDESIGIWKEMKESSIELNEFTYSALLDTCSRFGKLLIGEQIHACIQKMGLLLDTALANSLLAMYSICHQMEKAFAVFQEISAPDSVSWNAVVSGYAQNGFSEESVKIYMEMNRHEIQSNHMTFASIFMSCAMLTELQLGSQIHAQVIKTSFEHDLPVSNSLIAMYGKCGELNSSAKVFERIVHRDVITWNSMIFAYADHGCGRDAINVFEQMKISGEKPNDVTFIGTLSACSRAGLTSEAFHCFNTMYSDHGVVPSQEHYACMVDMLCRDGKLEEANELIESMPFDQCSLVWRTLLSACKVNGDVKLGKVAGERIIHMQPHDSASYVLLSDLYASVGKRQSQAEMRRLMEHSGVKKQVGCSWVRG